MGRLAAIALLGITIVAQTPADHQAVIARLGSEADLFERNAHRIAGTETLTQTIPRGVRTSRGPRGIETSLPGITREIVSDYGFISVDERGGSVREARLIRKVDGQDWRRKTTSLDRLAREIAARDEKSRRRQLEQYEDFGLQGFISDLGQLILLFARGGTERYEIQFERVDDTGNWAYTYFQLDGDEAFTIYGEGKQPTRQRMRGRVWVDPDSKLPQRISLDSDRMIENVSIRDVSTVEYARSSYGFLLPVRIVHQQFVGPALHVTDVFEYTGWREVLPATRQR